MENNEKQIFPDDINSQEELDARIERWEKGCCYPYWFKDEIYSYEPNVPAWIECAIKGKKQFPLFETGFVLELPKGSPLEIAANYIHFDTLEECLEFADQKGWVIGDGWGYKQGENEDY